MLDAAKIATTFIKQMTLSEKIGMLCSHQPAIPRLAIQAYEVGAEAAHGIVDRSGQQATSFPIPLGLAQTWNPDLLRQVGKVIGEEGKNRQIQCQYAGWDVYFVPTIDMERDPRWGRNEEGYGEDPYLTSTMASELVKGIQDEHDGRIRVSSTLKHFFGNNTEHLRTRISNTIPVRAQQDYYLKPFKQIIAKSHPQVVMVAYNAVNGFPGMQLPEINQYLRQEYGFDGFVISDGGALGAEINEYQYAAPYECVASAIQAGVDCFLDETDLIVSNVNEALKRGLLSVSDIDRAATRVLTVRARMGHFDPHETAVSHQTKAASVSYQAAVEQAVLLKNEQALLPLDPKLSYTVIGPSAGEYLRDWYGGYGHDERTIAQSFATLESPKYLGYESGHDHGFIKVGSDTVGFDGSTLVVDGSGELQIEHWAEGQVVLRDLESKRYLAFDEQSNRFVLADHQLYSWNETEVIYCDSEGRLENWQHQLLGITQDHTLGVTTQSSQTTFMITSSGVARAKAFASQGDVTLLVLGNHPMLGAREEVDRQHLELPDYQQTMIKAVLDANPQTVLILQAGYPFIVNWEHDHVPAILYTTYGGERIGDAVRDLILGQAKPSGKLVQTWYQDTNNLPSISNYDLLSHPRTYHNYAGPVLYPFGYGLTYGSLLLTSLSLKAQRKDQIIVTVTVENQDELPVTDTIQIYAYGNRTKFRRLVNFRKISLTAGTQKNLSFAIKTADLKYFDPSAGAFRCQDHIIEVGAGFDSRRLDQKISIAVAEDDLPAKSHNNSNSRLLAYDHADAVDICLDSNYQQVLHLDAKSSVTYRQGTFPAGKYVIQYDAQSDQSLCVNDRQCLIKATEHQLELTLNSVQPLIIVAEGALDLVTIQLKEGEDGK